MLIEFIPIKILETVIYNGWTVYDILEKIFCWLSRTQKNESEENMKNILIIALLAIIGFQWHAYDKLHNDYTNIIIAIQEEIL